MQNLRIKIRNQKLKLLFQFKICYTTNICLACTNVNFECTWLSNEGMSLCRLIFKV